MESKRISKFLSYAKKFLTMSFFSLVLSMSLSSKSVFAIDPAKLTPSNNELIYTDSAQPKVLYELSTDKKSFNAIVGDEEAMVYSQVSYTGDDKKELTLPVTSISADKGVTAFTLNLIDTKNDKVQIVPSEHGDLIVTLNYDGKLSQLEAQKLFSGAKVEMSGGKVAKLTVAKSVVDREGYDQYLGSEDQTEEATNIAEGESKTIDGNKSNINNSEKISENTGSDNTSKETDIINSDTTLKVTTEKSSGTTAKTSGSSSVKNSSTKISSSATKSASTKTSDASLIPLSLFAFSGASVLFFRKKD